MTLDPTDPRFAEKGLTVSVDGRTARVLQGEAEIAQVAVVDGQLVFLPNRSAKQKAVLRVLGVWVD